MNSAQGALEVVRQLGTVQQLQQLAHQGLAPAARPRVNSHIHLPPNFSAFETVAQAVDLAAQQQVGVVGVSNYYHYRVYADFVAQARRQGIFPLFGLEIICLIGELVKAGVKINDPGNPGKMYICGKGITRFEKMTPRGHELLGLIRRNDSLRMKQMAAKLTSIFEQRGGVATGLDDDAIKQRVVRRHGCSIDMVYLQERHLCQAFQEVLFEKTPADQRPAVLEKVLGAPVKKPDNAVAVQNDIRSCLMKAGKAAYVEETFVNFNHAYELILELGGIPCYPTLADGTSPICGYEDPIEKLIETLKKNRIYMAEFIPLRNTPAVLSQYVKAMRQAGIVGGRRHRA